MSEKNLGKIIAVDFDGTLCENVWPEIGAPRQAVIDYVLEEQRKGARLILWTNRSGIPLSAAVKWCAEQGIVFDADNENLLDVIDAFGNDCRKVFANEYIDDRAIPMPGEYHGLTVFGLVNEAHANAVKHGFWDTPPEFGTSISLIHSELSEALEEVRAGNRIRPEEPTPPVYYSGGGYVSTAPTACCKKPEGYATELADAVIRIADLCGYLGIDLEAVIREKMKYNATRPKMHGKNF